MDKELQKVKFESLVKYLIHVEQQRTRIFYLYLIILGGVLFFLFKVFQVPSNVELIQKVDKIIDIIEISKIVLIFLVLFSWLIKFYVLAHKLSYTLYLCQIFEFENTTYDAEIKKRGIKKLYTFHWFFFFICFCETFLFYLILHFNKLYSSNICLFLYLFIYFCVSTLPLWIWGRKNN